MRRSIGWIALTLGATLFSVGLVQAQDTQGRVVNKAKSTPTEATSTTEKAQNRTEAQSETAKETAEKTEEAETVIRTHEDLDVTPEEKQRAAAAHAAATAEEQRIASQLRGLQALMQKEEQDLAKRLAYAGQIREQGLSKNDQKLLDQAEALERQALDYYLKRIKQFEAYSVSSGSSSSSSSRVQPSTSNSRSTSSTRSSTTTRSSQNTTQSSRYRTRR